MVHRIPPNGFIQKCFDVGQPSLVRSGAGAVGKSSLTVGAPWLLVASSIVSQIASADAKAKWYIIIGDHVAGCTPVMCCVEHGLCHVSSLASLHILYVLVGDGRARDQSQGI